jgi:phosphopantetheine adenylyltransferase
VLFRSPTSSAQPGGGKIATGMRSPTDASAAHDMVRRASMVFEGVVVAIAANPGKTPLFSVEERVALARQVRQVLDSCV